MRWTPYPHCISIAGSLPDLLQSMEFCSHWPTRTQLARAPLGVVTSLWTALCADARSLRVLCSPRTWPYRVQVVESSRQAVVNKDDHTPFPVWSVSARTVTMGMVLGLLQGCNHEHGMLVRSSWALNVGVAVRERPHAHC